jgi:hypothetical protein
MGRHKFLANLTAPVLQLGRNEITRQRLIEDYQVGNMNAAAMLSKTLKRLRVGTIEQLAKIDPGDLYRVHGCGHTQVYVAMCLLDHHGYDIGKWWGWDVRGGSVLKHAREQKRKRGAQDTPTPPKVDIGATAH